MSYGDEFMGRGGGGGILSDSSYLNPGTLGF